MTLERALEIFRTIVSALFMQDYDEADNQVNILEEERNRRRKL
jgi:hypothetical protein